MASIVILDYCNGSVNIYSNLDKEVLQEDKLWEFISTNTNHRLTDISYMSLDTDEVEINRDIEL
jgi:hypothetical protein